MAEEVAPSGHVRTPDTDEVLRRIGRNVVDFQRVEHLMRNGVRPSVCWNVSE